MRRASVYKAGTALLPTKQLLLPESPSCCLSKATTPFPEGQSPAVTPGMPPTGDETTEAVSAERYWAQPLAPSLSQWLDGKPTAQGGHQAMQALLW